MTLVDQENVMLAAIEEVLGTVPFEPPITVVYCVAVRDALRPKLPGALLEAYFTREKLIVEAREGKAVAKYVVPLV